MSKLHKREMKVEQAKSQMSIQVLEMKEKNDLTDIEYLQWLTSMQQSCLKYMLRYERHGDYDTPGGLEK